MLIGDVIVAARALMPDLPRTLPGPTGFAAAQVAAPGSTLPAGTYQALLTFTNQWGETPASNIVGGIVIGANQGIQVTAPPLSVNPGATGFRVYFTISGQPFVQFISFPAGTVLPVTISTPGLPGTPPNRNTSFYPDSDGPAVSAYTIFDWLSDALMTASLVCKGIPDTSGIQMQSGQGFFKMPGIWDKLENSWFDGYPVAFDARSGAFYRNKLSGIVFIGILQTNADVQWLELQPQPDRTGGSTTTNGATGINDVVINGNSLATFDLSLGMFMLGDPNGNYEVGSYGQFSGAQLQGVARGLGGTVQQAWPNGTPLTELNFRFGGLRLHNQLQRYTPGMSASTLKVPPGWKQPLIDYLLSKFRSWERNEQGSETATKNFASFLKDNLRGTKQTAGPRQVGPVTPAGDGYPSASSGGRIIVP